MDLAADIGKQERSAPGPRQFRRRIERRKLRSEPGNHHSGEIISRGVVKRPLRSDRPGIVAVHARHGHGRTVTAAVAAARHSGKIGVELMIGAPDDAATQVARECTGVRDVIHRSRLPFARHQTVQRDVYRIEHDHALLASRPKHGRIQNLVRLRMEQCLTQGQAGARWRRYEAVVAGSGNMATRVSGPCWTSATQSHPWEFCDRLTRTTEAASVPERTVTPRARSSRSSERRMAGNSSSGRAERSLIVSEIVPGPVRAAICRANSAEGWSQVVTAWAKEAHNSATTNVNQRLGRSSAVANYMLVPSWRASSLLPRTKASSWSSASRAGDIRSHNPATATV